MPGVCNCGHVPSSFRGNTIMRNGQKGKNEAISYQFKGDNWKNIERETWDTALISSMKWKWKVDVGLPTIIFYQPVGKLVKRRRRRRRRSTHLDPNLVPALACLKMDYFTHLLQCNTIVDSRYSCLKKIIKWFKILWAVYQAVTQRRM